MIIFDNLKYTVNSIFDLYRAHLRRLYSVSVSFSIISTVASLVLAALAMLVVMLIIDIRLFNFDSKLEEFIWNGITTARFYTLLGALVFISSGIYSIYILQNEPAGFEEKPTFRRIIDSVGRNEWEVFVGLVVAILLFNTILYYDVFTPPRFGDGRGIWGGNGYDYNTDNRVWKFYTWLNSMIELVKTFLPYFLTMLLILFVFTGHISWENIKKFRCAFGASFILSFAMEELSASVISYFKTYIVKLIDIPFSIPVFPGIAELLFTVLAIGFFYPAFAGAMLYPFKFESERLAAQE